MKTWRVIRNRYSFDASVERTTTSQDVIFVQADAMGVVNGVLLFGTSGENVAAFAEDEWNYATEVEQP